MKQMKYLAFLLMAGMTLVACEDDDKIAGIDLTDHSVMTLTFEGNQWDALIDNPQYNGPLLYGENAKNYAWTDEETKLHGQMTNAWGGMYGFSEGGIAISNYIFSFCFFFDDFFMRNNGHRSDFLTWFKVHNLDALSVTSN